MIPVKDLRKLRAITNKDTRKLVLHTMKAGVRYRMTKSGIMFYASGGGTVGTHFTATDHRAHTNLVADLRGIGIDLKGKP